MVTTTGGVLSSFLPPSAQPAASPNTRAPSTLLFAWEKLGICSTFPYAAPNRVANATACGTWVGRVLCEYYNKSHQEKFNLSKCGRIRGMVNIIEHAGRCLGWAVQWVKFLTK
ncbi:hypothetical protein C8R45DRAFT_947586 [Mycena sanguinolenta]|nr:hypothetical protein C8R45DRAFT_947586 [Mycena sanguinolenta]